MCLYKNDIPRATILSFMMKKQLYCACFLVNVLKMLLVASLESLAVLNYSTKAFHNWNTETSTLPIINGD